MAQKNVRKKVEPKVEPEKEVVEKTIEPKKVFATTLVNVRQEPNLSAVVLRVLNPGAEETVIDEKDGWYNFADGGFSMKEYYK